MTSVPLRASQSFRDPAGVLVLEKDRALRIVRPEFAPDVITFLESPLAAKWTQRGNFVTSEILEPPKQGAPISVAHGRIFFPSYPWEWTPAQLAAAGELTLDLCDDLIDAGWILKDATPLNVLFDGPKPVFVDLLSVERRRLDCPIWLAYGQFVRTFLLPLAANRFLGWPLSTTLNRRDGYEPEELYSVLGPFQRVRAPWRSLVTLPVLLSSRADACQRRDLSKSPGVARAVLKHTVASLRRTLRKVVPAPVNSHWSSYPDSISHYSDNDVLAKTNFVRQSLLTAAPRQVLDIGSNTGSFSRLAAQAGAGVVAWDADVGATERAWHAALSAHSDVTTLVADFARPTPAAGWNNTETLSLLDRSRDRFDMVMMLAVIHHLLASHQIPLEHVARLTRQLTTRWLLIEWVGPDDPMFQKLIRGRESIYGALSEESFLSAFIPYFAPVHRCILENRRVLHLMEVR